MAATPPAQLPARRDTERLRAALNLGWSVAELRGRLRYGHSVPPGSVSYQFARTLHALPLGSEHTLTEQQIATRIAVALLAKRCELEAAVATASGEPTDWLRRLAIDLDKQLDASEARGEPVRPLDDYDPASKVGQAWDAVANAIYACDEAIQDRLAVFAELLAAYQLGRGLSETYWALDPTFPADDTPRLAPQSWEFLLGKHRTELLGSYLKLLERDLPPLAVPAVQGSLDRWSRLVTTGRARGYPDAAVRLLAQLQLWRDLLLGARDPATLAKKFGLAVAARQAKQVVRAFAFETLLAGAGIALLAGAGYWIGVNKTSSGWAMVASILGFFGVTGAGLIARARARAQILAGHLRDAFYSDIVSARATILPTRE